MCTDFFIWEIQGILVYISASNDVLTTQDCKQLILESESNEI